MSQVLSNDWSNATVRVFRKAFDIRRGETLRASLMLIYIFLVVSCLLMIKPVCNALFLSHYGASKLPLAFILVAISAASVVGIYSKLLKKNKLFRLAMNSIRFSVASLLLFWIFIYFQIGKGIVLYLFYIWVSIFAVIITSQFWLLANLVFNAREAKRLFGFIGSGAIAGGLFGGYLTNFLAPFIGSEQLLLICAGLLSLCFPIMKQIWRENLRNDKRFPANKPVSLPNSDKTEHPLKLIQQSRHLLLMAGLVGIGVLVAKLVEFQFSAIASDKIGDDDQLAAFFGFWLSNMNLASLIIQLFITRRVVGVFGVGTALFFLPAGILLGAIGILIHPGLMTAVLIKLSDGSLKQSVNKAGMELMALPIPVEIRNNTKTFIDVFVDSFATGISGVLLYIVTTNVQFSVRVISIIIIFLIAIWLFLVTRIRREYIQAFRLKIQPDLTQKREPEKISKSISIWSGLFQALESRNEQTVIEALEMIRDIRDSRLVPYLQNLALGNQPRVQVEALKLLYFYKNESAVPEIENLIYNDNFDLKCEAFRYLFQNMPPDRLIDTFKKYLTHNDEKIAVAALYSIAKESRNNIELQNAFRVREEIELGLKNLRLIEEPEKTTFLKTGYIRMLGIANIPELHGYLHLFLKKQPHTILKEAIIAASQTGLKEFVPVIFRYWTDKNLRETIRHSLAGFGPEIIDILVHIMHDLRESREMRLCIPQVIAAIGTIKSAKALTDALDENDLEMRFEIIKALNTLHARYPGLNFDSQKLLKQIFSEAKIYIDTLFMLAAQFQAAHTTSGIGPEQSDRLTVARRQLMVALEQKLDLNLERIFRLLELRYPSEGMLHIYNGLRKSETDLRINAIEFLDNVLETNLKKIIIPIVETTIVDTMIQDTLERFDRIPPTEFECLIAILRDNDNLLKIRALMLIAELGKHPYLPYVAPLSHDIDPLVSDAAEHALQSIEKALRAQ